MYNNITQEIESLQGLLIRTKINNPSAAKSLEVVIEEEITRLQKERSYTTYEFETLPQIEIIL